MTDKCNLCASDNFVLVKSELRDDKGGLKVYQCLSCGHLQLLPRPSIEEDNEFYNNNQQDRNRGKDIDFGKLKVNNLFDTKRHVRLVSSVCSNLDSRILDIGSGYGFFVNELYESGYRNVTGIEVSTERRELAIKHSQVRMINYDVNRQGEDIGRFDLITLFHVLEHMSDPIFFLKNIRSLMKDTGTLICEVPNVGEMLLDNCKEYNDFYWIRAHLNYFNSNTILDCLKKAGFENVKIRFEQRYGLLNLSNWLTMGKPQIDKPVFEINGDYGSVEAYYREFLEKQGRSDALIAIARA